MLGTALTDGVNSASTKGLQCARTAAESFKHVARMSKWVGIGSVPTVVAVKKQSTHWRSMVEFKSKTMTAHTYRAKEKSCCTNFDNSAKEVPTQIEAAPFLVREKAKSEDPWVKMGLELTPPL